MKFQPGFMKIALLTLSFVLMGSAVNYAQSQDEYRFKIHNNTKVAIEKVLVSEDGKDYGHFDIGDGIGAGQTATMVWDKSTNSGSCHQYFKAVFENDEESQAVKFDFCEEGLVLEFD